MVSRRFACAAASMAAGAAYLERSKIEASAPPICGVYELSSVWNGYSDSAVTETKQERQDALQDHRRQCTPRRVHGLLVYQEDGRMWTQYSEQHDDRAPTYTGYAGRWWLHSGERTFAPPHGQHELVEHHVRAASDPSLVGKTVMQRWALSDDRQRLTTTDVQILFGEPRTVEQLEWWRVGGAA